MIVIVTEFFHPHIGGQELRFLELSEQFINLGYEVHVLTIRYCETHEFHEKIGEIHVHRVVDDFKYESGGGLKNRSIKTILKFSAKSALWLKQHICSFVIFNQFPLLPVIASRLARITCPIILDFVEYRSGWRWHLIQRAILSSCDKVVCISSHVKSCVYRISNKPLYVIPSLVDTDKYLQGIPDYFVYIGRLEPHKHPEDAILSVVEFNKQMKSNRLIHVIGSGSLMDDLVLKYGSHPNVVLHGFVEEKKKIEFLSKAFALILPSEREGLPKSVIEAMASGVPTLTTDYPQNGTKEFVLSQKIGMVSQPNLAKMAECLNEIMIRYDELRCQCLKIVDNHQLKEGADRYIEIGREVI